MKYRFRVRIRVLGLDVGLGLVFGTEAASRLVLGLGLRLGLALMLVLALEPGLRLGLVYDCMVVEPLHYRAPLRSNDISVVLFSRLFASCLAPSSRMRFPATTCTSA